MSDSERPDMRAVGELEELVHRLGDELSSARRRARIAETRLRELRGGHAGEQDGDRESALERENAHLRARLDAAAERTRQLLERMRFLRLQAGRGVER